MRSLKLLLCRAFRKSLFWFKASFSQLEFSYQNPCHVWVTASAWHLVTPSLLLGRVEAAYKTLENLEQIISLERLAAQLMSEELQRSQEAYQQLLRTITQKRQP